MKTISRSFACFLFFLFAGLLSAQTLISAEFVETRRGTSISADIGIPVPYDVRIYKLLYWTPNIEGQLDTASGLLALPAIKQALPWLCYQHGTVDNKFDIPSRVNGESLIPVLFAGIGYAATAADYLGLGDSKGYHPYVHADSEATAARDCMLAAREYCEKNDIQLNGDLFVTGYSQGGHGAMALHQLLEAEGSKVAAAAPLSGPYAISVDMRAFILSGEAYNYVAYLPHLILSYQTAYGNLYNTLDEVFKPNYAGLIDTFYHTFQTGEGSLFSLNEELIRRLTADYGASIGKLMFQDSIITSVANDSRHPFNVALRDNDTYRWTPKALTRLYYCEADDQVRYTNSLTAAAYMQQAGAPDVEARSVGRQFDHGQCVRPALTQTLLLFESLRSRTSTAPGLVETNIWSAAPNPTNGPVRLQRQDGVPEKVQWALFDAFGRRLQNGQSQDAFLELDLSRFPAGFYQIWLQTETTRQVIPVLKNDRF